MDLKRGSSRWFLNQNHKNLLVPHTQGNCQPMTFHEIQKKGKIDPPYCTEGVGGGGEESLSISCLQMLLWDEDDICTVLFHSVIYNSVLIPYPSIAIWLVITQRKPAVYPWVTKKYFVLSADRRNLPSPPSPLRPPPLPCGRCRYSDLVCKYIQKNILKEGFICCQ